MNNPTKPTVAVYRRGFLPLSETFISDHINSLNRYNPVIITEKILNNRETFEKTPHLLHGHEASRFSRIASRLTGRYRALDTLLPCNSRSIVHAHFLQDGANILPFTMRRKVPLIVTAHGYDATVSAREHAKRTEGLWYLAFKPLLSRYANGVVCVSNWIKQCLVDNGYPSDKLRVIRLGINVQSLPRPAPSHQRRGTLFVGRLVEKKGVDYLLDAWSNLPASSRKDPLTI
ncbi:MAG: glycosyltransferase, partial [Sphingobium sp.]